MKNIILEIENSKLVMSLEFRPVIHFPDNKILRYEAIAKFFNIEGFQTPTQQTFYQLEQHGLTDTALDFLFTTVCDLLSKKESLALALNLSLLLINDRQRLDMLYKKCQQNGVQPRRIELCGQFSESQLQTSLTFLEQAKEYGFLTALDDVGSGGLPERSLQLFRFDTIRLAWASLERIAMDTVNFYRLQKVIGSFIAAGTCVICAGVKQTADLPLLNKYHHIGMQGYLFHRTLTFSQLQLLEDI